MRRLLVAAAAVALTACGQSAPPSPPASDAPAVVQDAIVIACDAFSADTNETGLKERFGAENVTFQTVDGPEGTQNNATILFANEPARRVQILWRDEAARAHPSDISISGETSEWAGPRGVRLGATLAEIEAANGKPFDVTGFEWDYGGTVVNWREGALAGREGCVQRIRFSARGSAQGAVGDSAFSSASPGMRAADPVVHEISVSYPAAN